LFGDAADGLEEFSASTTQPSEVDSIYTTFAERPLADFVLAITITRCYRKDDDRAMCPIYKLFHPCGHYTLRGFDYERI